MGNQLDFSQIYQDHAAGVRRILFGMCHPNELDDLVQVVFMKVYENLHTVRGATGLKGWIYRVALNTARDRMRSKKRGQWIRSFYDEELPNVSSNDPSVVESWEQRQTAKEWLDRLSPKLREVLVLYSLQEMEVKDIAQTLQIPEGTVKSRLHQAREILKPCIEKGKKDG